MSYISNVRYIISLVVVIPTFAVGCDGSCGVPPGGDGGVSSASVVLNEVMSRNQQTLEDAQGEFDDWAELKNVGAESVDLSGFALGDANSSGPFADGTTIPAGGYLIVFCDDTTPGDAAEPHFPFKISGDGDTLALLDAAGALVDELTVPALEVDESFGRLPDGVGEPERLARASPGAANDDADEPDAGPEPDAGCVTETSVVINEVLADNVTTNTDNAGDHDGWIELFNAGAAPVSLKGLAVDDDEDLSDGAFFLPDEALAAGGVVLVFADEEPGEGTLHTTPDVNLTSEDAVVVLGNTCGETFQVFSLAGDGADVSICLATDGDPDTAQICTPTPGSSNL